MKFTLIDSFRDLSVRQIVLFITGCLLIVGSIILFRTFKNKKQSATKVSGQYNTHAMVMGAMCIALAFVLSYIRLLKLPQGGSITPGSMLPIIIFAYWYGPKYGFTAAIAYSLLQYIQDPYFLNFAQFSLDYILGFGALGLAAIFPKNLTLGVIVSCVTRFACSLLSGILFFGDYAAEANMTPFWYSFTYQIAYMGPDTIICLVLALALITSGTLRRLRPDDARALPTPAKA